MRRSDAWTAVSVSAELQGVLNLRSDKAVTASRTVNYEPCLGNPRHLTDRQVRGCLKGIVKRRTPIGKPQ